MTDYGHDFQGFHRVRYTDTTSGKEVIHHLPEPMHEEEARREAYRITVGRSAKDAVLEREINKGEWVEIARWPFRP